MAAISNKFKALNLYYLCNIQLVSDKKNLKGGCPCGKVKYTITEDPLFTQACHCKNCKISTGSSYVVHTSVLEKSLIVEGEISSTELPTGSGKGYRAYFCAKCGVYIYCKYNFGKGRLTVRTKTLENPNIFPPQAHIFTKDKDPWINLTDDAKCFNEMYDPKSTWPEKSLKRYSDYLKANFE